MLQVFGGLNFVTHVNRDVEALYGPLQTACQRKVAKNILINYDKPVSV